MCEKSQTRAAAYITHSMYGTFISTRPNSCHIKKFLAFHQCWRQNVSLFLNSGRLLMEPVFGSMRLDQPAISQTGLNMRSSLQSHWFFNCLWGLCMLGSVHAFTYAQKTDFHTTFIILYLIALENIVLT